MLKLHYRGLSSKGQVLILAYLIIAVFIIIAASLSSRAINEKNISLRNKLSTEAFYLAEGGIEDAIAAFTFAIANYQIAPDVQTFNRSATYATFGGTVVNSQVTSLENSDRIIAEGQINVMVRNFEVTTSVTHPQNNNIVVTLHQIITRRLIPTFQHSVFYADDLEMLPGRNMLLSGRIHSNKDIYMDAESGVTLTIDSFYLHSAGNIYNQRKDSGAQLPGEVSIRVNQPGPAQYELMNNLDCDNSGWTAASTNRWLGTVESAVHGVTKLSAPAVASIQPSGYYAANARVKVTNGVVTKNGVTLTEGVDYPAGTVTTTTALYNNRETKYIKSTNIDLKKMAGYASADTPGHPSFPNNLPDNGLLYATRNDAPANQEAGVRLVNATEINRAGGLTVVSNDPVYIQGNFNTVNEKPASVICDSVNLLSGNWNDANSASGLSARNPTTMTVNCAFIAGVDQTSSGHYNGGLENYPRLHENWSGITLNIKGSFVELWNSNIATGSWVYGSPQYNAPTRNWIYNTNFNNPANLPPFTPWAVEAQRVAWWQD